MKKLSSEELRDRSTKGLCWNYNTLWSRDHHCKKGRLLMVEPIEESKHEKDNLEHKENAKEDLQLADCMTYALRRRGAGGMALAVLQEGSTGGKDGWAVAGGRCWEGSHSNVGPSNRQRRDCDREAARDDDGWLFVGRESRASRDDGQWPLEVLMHGWRGWSLGSLDRRGLPLIEEGIDTSGEDIRFQRMVSVWKVSVWKVSLLLGLKRH
ncbi:hypothetical protein BHM03_00054972 [Ensete ventricosum]|nr:hypothetical protein BHM03_00054972 [Ensete ventricosum]